MKKSVLSTAALVLVFAVGSQPINANSLSNQHASAHGHGPHLLLGQMNVSCTRGGGPASADFVTVHGHHALRLAAQSLSGNGEGEARGFVENVDGLTFRTIEVSYQGVCQNDEGFFEIAVDFTPPGGSSSQGISFRCPDMKVGGHPGQFLITPATIAAVTGDGSIPPGSTLHSININVQGLTPTLEVGLVFDVLVNGEHVLFDFKSPSASCQPSD